MSHKWIAVMTAALFAGCVGDRRGAPLSIHTGVREDIRSTQVGVVSPVVLDLGVGEAPYDDGFRSRRIEYDPARGFSDALVLLKLESRIAEGTHLVGAASALRVQDEPLTTLIDDPSISWLTLGLRFSW